MCGFERLRTETLTCRPRTARVSDATVALHPQDSKCCAGGGGGQQGRRAGGAQHVRRGQRKAPQPEGEPCRSPAAPLPLGPPTLAASLQHVPCSDTLRNRTKCDAPLPHRRSPSVSGSKPPSQSTTRAPALPPRNCSSPAGRPTAVARPAPPARRHGSAQHRPGPHSHHHAACMAVSLRPLVPPQAPNGLPHPGVDTCGCSAASLAHSTAV